MSPGLLIAARFGTGSAQVYTLGYDLDSIAAVVLGGTLLMGGRGSVAGTVGGVLILALLDTVFNVLQVDPFFKDVLRGAIIIAAVALYARRQIDPTTSRARFRGGGGARATTGRDRRRPDREQDRRGDAHEPQPAARAVLSGGTATAAALLVLIFAVVVRDQPLASPSRRRCWPSSRRPRRW